MHKKYSKIPPEEFNLSNPYVVGSDAALLETFGGAFDKIDIYGRPEDHIDSFLLDLGMPDDKILRDAFIVACKVRRVTFENILAGLYELYPEMEETIIKSKLKRIFRNWIKEYPEMVEKCHWISIMSVLRAYAKKFA